MVALVLLYVKCIILGHFFFFLLLSEKQTKLLTCKKEKLRMKGNVNSMLSTVTKMFLVFNNIGLFLFF